MIHNFGLINSNNLIDYGFVEVEENKLFDYRLPNLRFKKHVEFIKIRVKILESGIYILFYDLYDNSVIQFSNHNIKTIKDLSNLIFMLTKHKIKKV